MIITDRSEIDAQAEILFAGLIDALKRELPLDDGEYLEFSRKVEVHHGKRFLFLTVLTHNKRIPVSYRVFDEVGFINAAPHAFYNMDICAFFERASFPELIARVQRSLKRERVWNRPRFPWGL